MFVTVELRQAFSKARAFFVREPIRQHHVDELVSARSFGPGVSVSGMMSSAITVTVSFCFGSKLLKM